MSYLLECRKYNDLHIPLFFKFDVISKEFNLTSDKYLSIDNWMSIFKQLDERIEFYHHHCVNSSDKRNDDFCIENGRINVKVKWIKLSDKDHSGHYVSRILKLKSLKVGKYFLEIEITLESEFDNLIRQLENRNRNLEENYHSNNNHIMKSTNKPDTLNDNSTTTSNHSPVYNELEYGKVEEYIPTPLTSDNLPTYCPEKNSAQIEKNEIQSQYSPTYINSDTTRDSAVASYKPFTRSRREERNKTERFVSNKNHLSEELFGSSDDSIIDDKDVTFLPMKKQKVGLERNAKKKKRKKDSEKNTNDSFEKIGDLIIRNLMKEPIPDLLATFSRHEKFLTDLFNKLIKKPLTSYKSKDISRFAIQEILTQNQTLAMDKYLDSKLIKDRQDTYQFAEVIVDGVLPEWALRIFCEKFKFDRAEAIERLRLQATAFYDQLNFS